MTGKPVKRPEDDTSARRTLMSLGSAAIVLLCTDPFVHGAAQVACFSATSLCAIGALTQLAHVDWLSLGKARRTQASSADYEGLPQPLLIERLAGANRRVRIVDTICAVATDPENGPRMFEILADRLARHGEFVLEAAFLCPLSPSMKERAKRLNRTETQQERIAESTLGKFEVFVAGLPAAHRARVWIWLYKEPPSYASYRVDDSNLVCGLVGDQRSQDALYVDMAPGSLHSRQCDGDYDEIRRSGLPLAEHRTGTLVVHDPAGDREIEGVRFLRHRGEVFVAVTDRDDRAFVANCDSVTWRHCGEQSTWSPKAVDPRTQDHLQAELDQAWEVKYHTPDRPPFFLLGTVP
ncbi:hypothetical protein KGQ20_41130 [Catenulispora sp. NF23]|uniref:Uncharacterized protein n=1 Tax=Catenulispora pinistramenti TaxID=2705254 RepID=A0ABS5KYE2_9ACTN|nr:hypothetical protein [Catenulispora pinistramenti]MBS2539171.1 hypothetical protein [Catenulispora pinistramenti]MBS2551049.1 hypothetical protein [Catenulispora pinistramenti]